MKKRLFLLLCISAIIISMLSGCTLFKDTSDKDENKSDQSIDNGTANDKNGDTADKADTPDEPEKIEFTFNNITLAIGDSAQLLESFKIGDKTVQIEYLFDGNNISIEDGKLTALVHNSVTLVTARAEDFENIFVVTVRGDKGTMTIDAPERIYSNYAPKKINVSFSNPKFASEVTFTANDSRVAFEDGYIYATGTFSSEANVRVTATSEYHTEIFYVKVSTFNDHSSETKVQWYEKNIIKEENKGGTIFIGDSYFDGKPNDSGTPSFWKDFYTDYQDEKTFLMGISSSQIYHWEIVSERIVYPMEPREIVLHIGFNDVHSSDRSAYEIATRIIALLEEFREKLPDTKVYYCSIEPKKNALDAGSQFYERSMIFAPMINSMIEAYTYENTNVVFVDTRSIFFNQDGTIKKNYYLSTDLSHPTLEAYDEYRRVIEMAREGEKAKVRASAPALVSDAEDTLYPEEKRRRM